MNRIRALEKDILRKGARLGKPADSSAQRQDPGNASLLPPNGILGTSRQPKGDMLDTAASAIASWSASRSIRPTKNRRAQARGSSVLGYRVPDLPMALQQTSSHVGWAYIAAIMASWRDRQNWSPEEYIRSLGGEWEQKLVNNEPLKPPEVLQFLATVGFQVETLEMHFGAERLESMLREWGPLWVTSEPPDSSVLPGASAVLVGIHGPSEDNFTVDLLDPALGRELSMPLSEFRAKYGQHRGSNTGSIQIRHWPARAQQAAQQSLAWASQAYARAANAPAVAGAVIAAGGLLFNLVKELASTNGLTWTRSKLVGKTVPGNDPSKKYLADGSYVGTTIPSKRALVWEYFWGLFKDNVGAAFDIKFEYNGKCLANIRIENTSYAPGSLGRNISVDTEITQVFGPERDDICAVEVKITYQFTQPSKSAGTYTQLYTLFGDGRHEFSESRG
jgi:hypothetical protein